MATNGTTTKREELILGENREWTIFAFHGMARIVARKHGIVVPEMDLESLSDEELERRYRLIAELAHLPPA
jgi:hypothetical protein